MRDHRRQRRTLTSIAVEHILQNFLTPLMLKINVNVRRLIALLRNETLKQHAHPHRINRSHAEHIAHDGIRSRPTPLAQDALHARKLHDVMHRQKIRLIPHLLNQLKFVVDLRHGRFAGSFRPTQRNVVIHQFAQPTCRCVRVGHELFRVLILNRFEIERAAVCDVDRFFEQVLRIDVAQCLLGA